MLGVVSPAPAAPNPKKGEAVPGELIVAVKAGLSDKEQEKALQKAGVKVKKSWVKLKAKHGSADDVTHALKLLADDPSVRYAEPNYVVAADALAPNDPSFGELWGRLRRRRPRLGLRRPHADATDDNGHGTHVTGTIAARAGELLRICAPSSTAYRTAETASASDP